MSRSGATATAIKKEVASAPSGGALARLASALGVPESSLQLERGADGRLRAVVSWLQREHRAAPPRAPRRRDDDVEVNEKIAEVATWLRVAASRLSGERRGDSIVVTYVPPTEVQLVVVLE